MPRAPVVEDYLLGTAGSGGNWGLGWHLGAYFLPGSALLAGHLRGRELLSGYRWDLVVVHVSRWALGATERQKSVGGRHRGLHNELGLGHVTVDIILSAGAGCVMNRVGDSNLA